MSAAIRDGRIHRWRARGLLTPDRCLHRDLLLPLDPAAAAAAGGAQAAPRLAAARRPDPHVGRHHRRSGAHQGRPGHRAQRRVEAPGFAQRHREHPEPQRGGGGQAVVTVLRLHLLGSPLLRQKAAPVATVDDAVRRLVDDLFETMRAANQVGVPRRVAVVDVGESDPLPLVLINPRIMSRSPETETAEEGCLSIPEIFGEVERAQTVELEALDRDGRPYRATLSGFKARAAQHEIDHLDGVLFLDHLSAVKRGLLLAKWKKSRKGKPGYLKEVVPEPAGEL